MDKLQVRADKDTQLSPCVNICVVEYSVCRGCGRTLGEIRAWPNLPFTEKRKIMKKLKQSRIDVIGQNGNDGEHYG